MQKFVNYFVSNTLITWTKVTNFIYFRDDLLYLHTLETKLTRVVGDLKTKLMIY